jgi:RNA polymerase sigma-70 factor (ECF subfamily)
MRQTKPRGGEMNETIGSDPDWIRSALVRFERPLIAYAYRFTGDLETARDVVQDTFLKLCQADVNRLNGRLAGWLYTVCRNRALDVRKRDARYDSLREGQAESVESPTPWPSAQASSNETNRLILDAVAEMPERRQEVFRLKFQDGLTYREISAVTGLPLSTVSYHVHASMTDVCERLRACSDRAHGA